MAKLCLIQLSDLHIHGTDDPTLKRLEALPSCVEPLVHDCASIVLLVSGDIASSGQKEEYDCAHSAFKTLYEEIGQRTKKSVTWVIVPGNHDGAFKASNQTRRLAIKGILSDVGSIDESVILVATEPQQAYFEFVSNLRGRPTCQVFADSLLSIQEVLVEEKVVSFWEFNASWMSTVPEKQGQLVFPVDRYSEHLRRSADLRVAVLHHPLNWYAQDTYHPLRQLLTASFNIVLSGHEHVQNGYIQRPLGVAEGRECLFIEGGALGPHSDKEVSEFNVTKLDTLTGALEEHRYTYNNSYRRFLEDTSRREVLSLSLASARDFELTKLSIENLEEMAAPFSHPTRDVLRLSDIYVEPALLPIGPDEANKPSSTISDMLRQLNEARGLLVRADEHHGKTSLVNQLMLRLVQRTYIPLTVSAREIATGTDARRERFISEAVAQFYGDAAVPRYQAADRSRKIALIDDLDKLGANPDQYERALTFLLSRFQLCIVTVSDRFDVSMLGSTEVSRLLSEFSEYKMRGFSYAMRTELIQRWYTLDSSLDKPSLEAKIHAAQIHIDHAVAKALVPSTAFNTLMILQGLEATQKSNPIDAGVAQHYDAMLRRRLTDSGSELKEIDGTYAYLGHLSWWMRQRDVTSIDRSELLLFNDQFRRNVHSTDTTALVELLVRARILSSLDATYQFRHPSARYFFLAYYIGENQEDDQLVKNVAVEACRRLYKRDNGNLVVFLASKTSSRWILKEVADVLKKLLEHLAPFNALSDSKVLNSWVTQTAKLAVDSAYDPGNRRRAREQDEEAQRLEDDHDNGEGAEDVTQLDLFSQINLVFKTSEILGLILKSKFGSLNAQLKKELLQELFTGPLRAISYFLSIVNEDPQAFIQYLSTNWSDKLPHLTPEQREKLAQRFLYSALGAYSQALIQRQGEITGSPDLAPYISAFVGAAREVEEANQLTEGTCLTYRLLSVACSLSYPGDIPMTEIEKLGRELKANPFAFTILQGLIGNHLYMFPVNYSVRQRLASAVDLDLKSQIANEVTKRDAKTIANRQFSYRNPKSLLGVDPVAWTPDPLGSRSPTCPRPDRRTRRNSVSRCSSWWRLARRRPNWPGSSMFQPRRSPTGWDSLPLPASSHRHPRTP